MSFKRMLCIVTISCFFAIGVFAATGTTMKRDSLHVGIVKNTYNSVYDMTGVLESDLKKYCTTFYIENDKERAYINALGPLRKAKEAYTKFANSVQRNDLDAIKTSEEEFIKYEEKLNETIRYFTPSINQTVKDYVVVPKKYYESEYIFKDDVPVEYAIYESKTFDVKALFDENVIVANIICQENDFDMLVIPSSSSISSTLIRARLKLYNRLEKKFYTLYDSIVEMSSFADLSSSWVLLLASHISAKEYALYSFQVGAFAVSLEIDGVKSPLSGVVLPGKRTVKLSSPGRRNKVFEYDFQKGIINQIEADMVTQKGENLQIQVVNADSAVLNYGKLSFLLPYTIQEYETPFNYSVSAPGFVTKNNALTSPKEDGQLKITLRPEWADRPSFVKGEKVKFYSAFTATLASFAITVVAKSFYSSGKNTAVWSSIDSISTGLVYASLGVLFGTLVDYFISSKYMLY